MAFEIRYNEEPISHSVHTHTYYELLYVLSGAVNMRIRDRDYLCPAGSLVFLNPFDEHASTPVELPYKRYYLLIPPTQLTAFHNDLMLLSVFRFHGSQFPYVLPTGELRTRFDAYFSLFRTLEPNAGDFSDARFEAIMTLILTDAYRLSPDMFTPANQLTFLPVQDILGDLDNNIATPFSLADLAAKYHVSPGCLSSHFRRIVGLSPMQYVTQSRLMRARMLLLTSELSVTEIASMCGYPDVSNFTRRFHQQFQTTPLQFRQKESKHRERQILL